MTGLLPGLQYSRMETDRGYLSHKGIRCTPQRLEVLRIVRGSRAHLSAETLYSQARCVLPAVSFATVYAILELFKEKEIVSEIRIQSNKSLYELTCGPHHHFLCRLCGKIYDIDKGPCPVYSRGTADGHSIESFQGYFYGVCKLCSKKGRAR